MEFPFTTMLIVLIGACLVGGFVEDAGRRRERMLERLEEKLDAALELLARNQGAPPG